MIEKNMKIDMTTFVYFHNIHVYKLLKNNDFIKLKLSYKSSKYFIKSLIQTKEKNKKNQEIYKYILNYTINLKFYIFG